MLRCVAQPGSALAWGARGRRFESFHTDHMNKDLASKGAKSFFVDFSDKLSPIPVEYWATRLTGMFG